MVTLVLKKNASYYPCQSCQLLYRTRALAQQCEDFCKAHNSCNLGIIKHAVKAT